MSNNVAIGTVVAVSAVCALAYLWCKFANVEVKLDEDDEGDEPWW